MTNLAARLPQVSVLIRSMDRPSLMEVLACIDRQHDVACEVIVVNATGAEHSPLPECAHPIRLIGGEEALNRAQAANMALDNATAPYALFVDDDDLIDPPHLKRLTEALAPRPDTPAAYAGVRLEQHGEVVSEMDDAWREGLLFVRNTLPIHAVLFRMSAVNATGMRFDTTLPVLEDWDFWLQLVSSQGAFLHVPGCSATYRLALGASGLSHQRDIARYQTARRRLYAKWLPTLDIPLLGEMVAEFNDANDQQRWDIKQLREEIDTQRSSQEARYQALEDAFNALLASRSMRLTAPLRYAAQTWRHWRARMHQHPRFAQLPAARTTQSAPCGAVDVIVPVYKGLDETQACLESVWASTPQHDFRLVVINDASPEPELTEWLRSAAKHRPMVLLENAQNLGFVGTVNRGMRFAERADVVLLNSDAEVANDWLDRLIAAAYQDGERPVSSVTPFSNNATICSYPRFCEDNELPNGYDLATLDGLFAATNAGQSVDIPTAIGFCMYIRRDSLDAVGLFDEDNFGKGYGEENDFCMRTLKAGWRHVHALDVFAWHKGSVSFGDSQPERVQKALAVMDALHPDFQRRVHTFIQQDPAKPARMAVEIEQLHHSQKPCALMLNHQRGGGTEQHCRELAGRFPQVNWLMLRPDTNGYVQLSRDIDKGALALRYHVKHDWKSLVAILSYLGVQRLHWHHWLGFDAQIHQLANALKVPQDVTLHDFYSVCPQISLTSGTGRYCGEQGPEQCRRCLNANPVAGARSIEAWRAFYGEWLAQCERIITPSQDTARRIHRYFPSLDVQAEAHPDQLQTPNVSPAPIQIHANEPLRIAVLGALSALKGADTLELVAQTAAQQHAPLHFTLFGYGYRALKRSANLQITGPYEAEALPQMLREWRPHVVWFPAQGPETYSYTLSTCLAMGLPVIGPNLGAFPERLEQRPHSWVVPWDCDTNTWVAHFLHLHRHGEPMPDGIQTSDADAPDASFYRQGYIEPFLLTRASRSAPLPSDWEQHIVFDQSERTWRRQSVKLLYRLRELPLFRAVAQHISPAWQRRLKSYLLGER